MIINMSLVLKHMTVITVENALKDSQIDLATINSFATAPRPLPATERATSESIAKLPLNNSAVLQMTVYFVLMEVPVIQTMSTYIISLAD